ncbi:MAG: EAL domain-containing protein [Acidobacteriota bacterium]
MAKWYLEGFIDDRRDVWRTPISSYPFVVGRRAGVSLHLASPEISGRHAEMVTRDGWLWVRDLGSKNGTFINEQPLETETRVAAGDVLRFANREFRLVSALESTQGNTTQSITQTVALPSSMTPSNLARRLDLARQILENRNLVAFFQPIVRLDSGGTIAYEALARGLDGGDLVSPGELFELASALDKEADLSRAMRHQAVLDSGPLLPRPVIFVNTHPAEVKDGPGPLLDSLGELSRSAPHCDLVLEIHEAAVATPQLLRDLGRGLAELNIDLAFDDFGTGQARLLELVEVAPKYLKFDRAWISGVDQATDHRIELLSNLVSMVRALGVMTLAEGVETEGEAAVCRDLGFELAQGYHFGRPAESATFVD